MGEKETAPETPAPDTETDVAPETPAPDTETDVAPETPSDPPAKVTLDDLLAEGGEWLKANLELTDGRDLPTPEQLAALPPEGKRYLAAVVNHRKAELDSFAEREAKLAERTRELEARERLTLRRQSEALKWLSNPKLESYTSEPKDPTAEPEFGTPEWVSWAVRKELGGFFGALRGAQEDLDKAAQEAEARAAHEAAVAKDAAYIAEHEDDFTDPTVFAHIERLVGLGHEVAEAHKIALLLAAPEDAQAEADKARRSAARERVQAGGRTTKPPLRPPPNAGTRERAEFYADNPDAARERIEEYRRRTGG